MIRFEHGGGIDTMRVVVEHFGDDDRARAAFGLPGRVWCRFHVAIYDHDGETRDHPSANAKRLGEACEGRLSHHRLRRRDQEHYLPPDALRELVRERVTNAADRTRLEQDIDSHIQSREARHFAPLPRLGSKPFFKSEFNASNQWPDGWFRADGTWSEMTAIAEKIAAAL